MATALDMQAQEDAFSQQYDAQQAAKKQQEQQQAEPSFLQKWVTGPIGRVTTQAVDSAVATADQMYDSPEMRKARDVAAGAMTGAANIADAGHSVLKATAQNFSDLVNPNFHAGTGQPAEVLNAPSPVWDHAKQSILDFRDAVSVQDPSMADGLVQSVAQLAIPFAGYSRALGGVHGLANAFASGALTDLTALAPHDMRMADLVALGRHTEGKLGDALRALAPDGSAVNAYVNFLADRDNESEAEGRFKNVLDGFGTNLIATPLLHSVAMVLKQGQAALRYGIENIGTGPVGRAAQEGKIGYHGTPNQPFNAFDDSKIGSGEGAQVYGYGHYIAENIETGDRYQKSLSGRMNNSAALSDAQAAIRRFGGDKVRAFTELTSMAANEKDPGMRMRLENSARIIKSGNADNGRGSLLRVDIPDEHIDNMLDHDKPLEKQPQILSKIPVKDQQSLQKVLDDHGQDLELGELTGNEFRQVVERAISEGYLPLKGDGGAGVNIPQEAAEYLNDRGIPGIKYLDSKSRVTGEGTRNFVVFKGKNIKVLGEEK